MNQRSIFMLIALFSFISNIYAMEEQVAIENYTEIVSSISNMKHIEEKLYIQWSYLQKFNQKKIHKNNKLRLFYTNTCSMIEKIKNKLPAARGDQLITKWEKNYKKKI